MTGRRDFFHNKYNAAMIGKKWKGNGLSLRSNGTLSPLHDIARMATSQIQVRACSVISNTHGLDEIEKNCEEV
jgi:hypothetical protein